MNEAYRHPHAELILIWARQKASGEIDAGWWAWTVRNCTTGAIPALVSPPFFNAGTEYGYTMTDKHPAKPRTITVTIPMPEETGVIGISERSVQVVFSSTQDRIIAFNAIRAAMEEHW